MLVSRRMNNKRLESPGVENVAVLRVSPSRRQFDKDKSG